MDNKQPQPEWAKHLKQLRSIEQSIGDQGFLAEALRDTRALMAQLNNTSLTGRLDEIENDYRLMCDFMRKGYPDDRRQELYDSLSGRLYRLLKDMELDLRKSSDPSVMGYAVAKADSSFDIDAIKQRLESFVSDLAMASLDSEDVRVTRVQMLHTDHHQYMQGLFGHMLFSALWTPNFASAMADLLVSPTIDTADAQLLVSGVMLGAMLSGDHERVFTLLKVYEQASDERIRQRALVGWAFAVQGQPSGLSAHTHDLILRLLQDKKTREELLELQIQVAYCTNAKRDNERLQRDIMPGLLRNQGIEISELGIREADESNLDEILNPDAADQKMEEMEKGIRKMMDMRDQGVDIYFGGFSHMKRFSFFYTLSNWFVPFYIDHPQLQHIAPDFLRSGMVTTLLNSGTFCDSDRYSFVLGTSSVFHNLPANIKEMLSSGNVTMMGMPEHLIDTQSPSYIRRMYLQDLYRFFTISDARAMFNNPFDVDSFLFMTATVFASHMADEARRVQRFLLKQKMYGALSKLFYVFKSPDRVDDMRMEARLKTHNHMYLQAQAIYARVLEQLPDDERTMTDYAQASFYAEDYAEAARVYAILSGRHPENRSMALRLSIAQINSGDAEEAMQTLYRLDYEKPNDIFVRRAMAWGHLWLTHLNQAETLYQEILAGTESNTSDSLNAAYCNWFSGKVDKAIVLMRQAMQHGDHAAIAPDDVMKYFTKDMDLMAKYNMGHIEQRLMAELVAAPLG